MQKKARYQVIPGFLKFIPDSLWFNNFQAMMLGRIAVIGIRCGVQKINATGLTAQVPIDPLRGICL